MNTPIPFTPYLNPALEQALLALSTLWTDGGGSWQPLPGTQLDMPALIDALTQANALAPDTAAPMMPSQVVAGALYAMPDTTSAAGTLYLSAANWHKLMLRWPAADADGLALFAQAAGAVQQGEDPVRIAFSAAQWLDVGTTVFGVLGPFANTSGSPLPPVSDLFSLHAAIAAARGFSQAVIADVAPLDESNRYARFAIAVNVDSAGHESVLLGRALFESIRAIWPEAVSGEVSDVGRSTPIGVVRLQAPDLGGLSVGEWLDALAQHGAIDAGQIVHTSIDGDPASLIAFNDGVRTHAFASDFQMPGPYTLSLSDGLRDAVLSAALSAASAPLRQAAGWLDLCRLALESGARQDGWIALDTTTGALVDPDRWPADHALLAAALRLPGTVRKSIVGATLGGTLDRALATGEVLEIRVGDTVLNSAQAGSGLSVDGKAWTLVLADDQAESWRDVSVTRVNGSTRELVQSVAVLDRQTEASVSVQAAALGRWYGQGSTDLGLVLGTLLGAAAAAQPGGNGLDLIDIEALQGLLFDPALQHVLASQGFVLPTQAIASPALTDNASRIGAWGELHDVGGRLTATRETLLAWASTAREGGGYARVPMPGARSETGLFSRPTVLFDAGTRTAHEAEQDRTKVALSALQAAQRTALDRDTPVDLGLNLPIGATCVIEIFNDSENRWEAVTGTQALLSSSKTTLVRVRDIVLPGGATTDTDLTLTATRSDASHLVASATTRLIDPARPRLTVEAASGVDEADGHAVFSVKLSEALAGDLDLTLALQHEGTDAGDFGNGFEVWRDGDQTWTALSGTSLTLLAGETVVQVRHAVVADALAEEAERWRLQVTASGAGASTLGSTNASAQAVLIDTRPQALSVHTRDVGQGEGEVGFQVLLARATREPLTLQFTLVSGAGLDLNAHEFSLDGGTTWEVLSVGVTTHQARVNLDVGDNSVLLRSRVNGMAGIEPTAAVSLTVNDISGHASPLEAADASALVWRHGSTPHMWVDDVRIDAASGEAVFTVRLSGTSNLPVTVDYTTALPGSGAADPTRDFIATSGRLVFGAGVTEQQVRVGLRQGWEQTIDERAFQLALGNPLNASLGDDSATATLIGVPPHLVISGAQADETAAVDGASPTTGRAFFQVGLSHARASATTLFIEVQGDDADGDDDVGGLQVYNAQTDAWDDYVAANGVTLAGGQTRLLVRAALHRRTGTQETDERLTLRVSADAVSAAALARATASAPLILLGDADLPGVVAREATTLLGGGGAVFELSGSGTSWVGLTSVGTDQLTAALGAAGLDVALLGQMQRVRHDAQGVAETVYDATRLDQLQRVLDQRATALALRLRLDDVVGLHASATLSIISLGGAQGANIAEKNATSTALLDALAAMGLPVHLNPSDDMRDGLGAVMTTIENRQVRYVVSGATLDFWAAELQRRHDRALAIELRQRMALLSDGDSGVAVALGTSAVDGSGSADRWLAELGSAGVLLLDVSDNAFDPEAIGGIFRRRDADGVERLYVSQDTLASWSEQLAVRAALATSNHNGGLEDFAQTYLRDKATFDADFPLRNPDLGKMRIAYSTNTLVRNIFWYWKDMQIERVHYVSNQFYLRLEEIQGLHDPMRAYLEGKLLREEALNSMNARLYELEKAGLTDSALPYREVREAVQGVLEIEEYGATAKVARGRWLKLGNALDKLLQVHGTELTKADVKPLTEKADHFEYLKEGEQISRLVFAAVAAGALIPATHFLREQQLSEGKELAAAYTGLMGAQIFLQAMHMFVWFGSGALDNHLNAKQLMARNEELVRRTLRDYGGGHNLWDAFVAMRQLRRDVGGMTLDEIEQGRGPIANKNLEAGATPRLDSIVVFTADGSKVNVRMNETAPGTDYDGAGPGDIRYELSNEGGDQFVLRRRNPDGTSTRINNYRVLYEDPAFGYLIDTAGIVRFGDGSRVPELQVALWQRLDPDVRARTSIRAVDLLLRNDAELYTFLNDLDSFDVKSYSDGTVKYGDSLVDALRGEVTFWTTEEAAGFKTALDGLLAGIKTRPALETGWHSGKQAYELATSQTDFGQTLDARPEMNRFDLYIEGAVAPKGIRQDLETAIRDYGTMLEATPDRANKYLERLGVHADELQARVRRLIRGESMDDVEIEMGGEAPMVRRVTSKAIARMPMSPGRLTRVTRANKLTPEVRQAMGADPKAIGELVPDADLLSLWPEYDLSVGQDGTVKELPYSIRQESMSLVDADGKPLSVSLRKYGQYWKEALVFAGGRYSALLASDVVGIVASGVGIAAVEEELNNLKNNDPDGTKEETRRMRALLEGELAKQALFTAAYTVLTGAHVGLAITSLPGTAAAVPALRGLEHGLSLVASMGGSAMVLASELVNAITYGERWRQSGHRYQEDLWGRNGALMNSSMIVLDVVLSTVFPAVAMPLGIGMMFLPNWGPIGAAMDIEADTVASLRRIGRDAEADMAETLAAASYRAGKPIFGWFSPIFTKEMVKYQLGHGVSLRTLLGDDTALLGALHQLEVLQHHGQLPAVHGADVIGRYSDTPTGSPPDLIVPLNEYLTGDGHQVTWSFDPSLGITDAALYEAMTRQAARLMAERLKAQRLDAGTEDARNWFHVAFKERIAASNRSWESASTLGETRQAQLATEVAALRQQAASDRDAQLMLDSHSATTVAAYNLYQQVADSLGVHFSSAHLRVVGDLVYDGSHYLGNLKEWQDQAARDPAAPGAVDPFTARAERYQASLILAHFNENFVSREIAGYLATLDRTDPDFGLAQVDRLIGMLRTSVAASDVFQIASRSEDFRFGRNAYDRTQAYSNYSTHADDAHSGNVEWVDGSYLMHVGRPDAGADGRVAWWGGWQEPARPSAPEAPSEDATREDIRLYNLAVVTYNAAVDAYNTSLKGYLDSILARPVDERGADPGIPPIPLSALQAVDPGSNATADELAAHDNAAQSASATTTWRTSVLGVREQALQARYLRLQNALQDGQATEAQRYALSSALGKVHHELKTQVSGNTDNSVADRWVIGQDDITRDRHGLALGTEVRFLVRDEGGNTLRALEVDASAIDDLDQVFHVERGNVRLFSGDSDDTFILSTAQDVHIHAGLGEHDQVLFMQATEGQTIQLDHFVGVVTVMGSAYSDTVRSSDEANHHYIDQSGTALGAPGDAGDDVQITGPGSHLIEIRSGRVLTGAGDDVVLVREHVGGTLDIDLGAGENVVSFAYLPGVRLQRDFSTGDYRFNQVTWILGDAGVDNSGGGTLGWGLNGSLRNVQQIAGSEMGDHFQIDGGIHALQANGGDDRIVLRSGDIVADGGAGADHIEVAGAHNTRVIMDDEGDLVTLANTVQDAMVLVGAIAGAPDAPSGNDIHRGTIDASASSGSTLVDVVDGVVTVKVGTGHTVINLLSATARVVIEDHPGRVDAGGTIEFNLLPGASLDDLALRRYLADTHAVVQGGTPTTSLLDGQVRFVIPPGPHHAYRGVSLKATNIAGQPVTIDLAQALPDTELPAAPASPLQVLTDGHTVHAWAGVRTVVALEPATHIQGAWSQADAQAHRNAVQAQQDAALLRQSRAQDAIGVLGALQDDPAFGDSLQAWLDDINLANPTSLQAWVAGGAQIDRWVVNAGDLVPGVPSAAGEDLHGALADLGWSAAERDQVDAALDGRAAYSARLDSLVASQATVATWRSALAAYRENWTGHAGMQATLDHLDAQLAAVPTTGSMAGWLSPALSLAVQLVKDLAALGILTPAQATIVTGFDLDRRGNHPPGLLVHTVAVNEQLSWADPALQGLGVGSFDPTEPLAVQYGSEGMAVVVVDPTHGSLSISREGLQAWYVDAINQRDNAKDQAADLGVQLAGLSPYQVKLASGAALYTGLSNDTTHDTLEVTIATPLQQALSLQARHGEHTASTQLWLQVERFEGLTRTGSDGTDVMVASGAHANLLAGGRGMDLYTVRDDRDLVFENPDEGIDQVTGLGTSHTLNDNVERLALDYAGAPGAVLYGTGNALDNDIYGNRFFANVLDGREGADHLYGGLLDDVYHVDNLDDGIHEFLGGGVDWVYSTIDFSLVDGGQVQGEVENLRLLGDQNLDGTGNALANRLEGNAGNNRLDGGAGADTLLGGLGDDTYVVDDAGDVVTELANEGNEGNDTVLASLSYTLGDHLENLTLTGSAHLTATGNAADNRLRGNAGKNRIDGGDGFDTVVLSGSLQDYTFLYTTTGEWAIGDHVANRDNVDRFSRVESVFFEGSGQTLTLQQLIALGQSGGADVHLSRAYVASYTDLSYHFPTYELTGLDHYFNFGYAEGRQVGFDPWQYMAANADIANLYNLDPSQAAWHYINAGRSEGRAATSTLAIQRGADGGVNLNAQAGVASALFGGTGNDQLYGSSGNDALLGGAGDDSFDGGSGADRMGGGTGNDKYTIDNAADVVHELANQGTDTAIVVGSDSHTLAANVENGQLMGNADINLTGNSGNNVLLGNAGSNVLNGGAGTDTVLLDAPLSAWQFMRLSNGEVVMGPLDPSQGKADRLVGIETLQIMATGELISLATLAMPTMLAYTASLSAAEINTLGIDENAAALHYITTGQPQGRTVTFDALRYMASNVDVPVVLGFSEYQAAKHYIQYGRNDGIHAAPDASLVLQIGAHTGVTLTGQAGANDGLFGGNGNDTLNGGDGSDGLVGGAGNDVLDGGTGADRMGGGTGDDTYYVDNVGDVVYESIYTSQGTDTVISSITYTLPTSVENGQLTDGADINLTGNAGSNRLRGNAGKNRIDGGAGSDTLVLSGSLQDYTFIRTTTGEWVVGDSVANRDGVDRFSRIESVSFEASGQTVALADLNAHFVRAYVASYSDLSAQFPHDELAALEHYFNTGHAQGRQVSFDPWQYMAANADVANFYNLDPSQAAWHYIHYGRNEGRATTSTLAIQRGAGGGVNLNAQAGVASALFGGTGNDQLHGSSGNDALLGGAGDDTLDGGSGADRMGGGTGNDQYTIDNTGDLVYELANQGTDTVISGITYTLPTHVENGQLAGNADLSLTGNSGNNLLTGNAGNNLLDGGSGADTMAGGVGDDIYCVDNAGDVVIEYFFQGTDTVRYSGADGTGYALPQPVDNIELLGTNHTSATGNWHANVLTGNAGNNLLDALESNDTLIGGAGSDELLGGAGSDTYRFARGDGQDAIQEAYNDGASTDRIEFQATGLGAVGFDQLWFSSQDGYGATITVMGTHDSVTIVDALRGAGVERITAADLGTSDPNDVRTLSASGLEQLVIAMASMTLPPGATSWNALSAPERNQLLGIWAA